jgi:hypothetical protein
MSCLSAVLNWLDGHAGLAGWVGSVGSIFAVVAAWLISRAEYQRGRRLEIARQNREICRFEQITGEFHPIVLGYLDLVDAGNPKDPTVINYQGHHQDDAQRLRMDDLDRMPVTLWPSLEAFDNFKCYFDAAKKLLATPPGAAEDIEKRRRVFAGKFEALQQALRAARKK